MKVIARIVELSLDSLNREKVETEIRKDVSVSFNRANPFVQIFIKLIINAVFKKIERDIIGDSGWKIVGLEKIEVVINGRFETNDLQLP